MCWTRLSKAWFALVFLAGTDFSELQRTLFSPSEGLSQGWSSAMTYSSGLSSWKSRTQIKKENLISMNDQRRDKDRRVEAPFSPSMTFAGAEVKIIGLCHNSSKWFTLQFYRGKCLKFLLNIASERRNFMTSFRATRKAIILKLYSPNRPLFRDFKDYRRLWDSVAGCAELMPAPTTPTPTWTESSTPASAILRARPRRLGARPASTTWCASRTKALLMSTG